MKKNCKKYLSIAGMLMVLLLAAIIVVPVNAETKETDTIPQRVYFGDICVGGMTQDEAKAAVQERMNEMMAQVITLQAGKNAIQVPVSQFGITWRNPEITAEAAGLGKSGNLITRYKAMKDLENEDKIYELSFAVDTQKAKEYIEANAEQLNTEAVDADVKRENGTFTVIPGSQGVKVNVEESAKLLENYFMKEWDGNSGTVELVADVVDPRGTDEDFAKVKDLLGGFHTSYSTSAAGRCKNVENGASKIDGSVIYPGDSFSVYEAVSPFDAEHGYELAGSYENGTTVETYGGGICQVSTTLYNAVIRAELDVTERYNHSMIVSYVDPSADAAIAGTYKDLKFTNNTDAPIYIEGYTQNKEIYFNIYGHETRAAGREVSFVSETLTTTEPGVQFKVAADQPIGYISKSQSSHTGYTAQLWKVVTVNGVEESREVFNKSTYKPSPKIVIVGIASANPEATGAMNAAVASQDEATINAAAAQWNDAAQAAAQQAAAEQAALQQQQQEQQQQEQENKNKKNNKKDKKNDDGDEDDEDDEDDDEDEE